MTGAEQIRELQIDMDRLERVFECGFTRINEQIDRIDATLSILVAQDDRVERALASTATNLDGERVIPFYQLRELNANDLREIKKRDPELLIRSLAEVNL